MHPIHRRLSESRMRASGVGGRGRQVNLYADGAAGIRFHSDPGAPRAQKMTRKG